MVRDPKRHGQRAASAEAEAVTTRPLPFDCPRGLSRCEAARYIGVSSTTFDKLVEDGSMPKPLHIRSRRVWDRHGLDIAFTNLQGGSDDEPNEWDE